MENSKFYMMDASSVSKKVNSNLEIGLTDEMVELNKEKYGSNNLTVAKGKSFLEKVLEALCEPMTIILIVAALITIGINLYRLFTGAETDFVECTGILVAIFLSAAITIVMEGHSEKAFQALQKIQNNIAVKVRRNGIAKIVSQSDLVVGDIVTLETGDKIPADCYIISANQLTSDEASLTGESLPIHKIGNVILDNEDTPLAERVNMLYAGCYITTGSCEAIVVAVGDHTELGKIAHELKHSGKQTTPLQEKLDKLGQHISIFAIGAAILIFIAQIIQKFYGVGDSESIGEIFITSIALIVAAVPEGLSTIVAISLALNVIKMAKENALVKKMVACETIGAVNIICSDKTGTLTQNKMKVMGYYDDKGWHQEMEEDISHYLTTNICVNSSADIDIDGDDVKFLGNPTESAMLAFYQCSCPIRTSKKSYKDKKKEVEYIKVFPFSSEEKHMTTVVRNDKETVAYVKGSPEKIISMCKLDNDDKYNIELEIFKSQEKAMRVIGFAHKILKGDIEDLEKPENHAKMESDMVFDGFVIIYDPLRPEVLDAVRNCRMAGINLKILTGDHVVTARAIANELNILTSESLVLTAKEIEEMDDEKLASCIDNIVVIARSTPTTKLRVVKMLRERGNTIAVTGDGVNDAPAIKNADVGIAMGIAGTEVSREAADIVLLDDSFATIAKAIKWGRNIYQNFQRFITFQLTVNVSAVLIVFVSVLLGYPAPFTALQLLWINIIMDGPPALTLGLEPVRNNLMQQKPINRKVSIITKSLWLKISSMGVLISLMLFSQMIFNVLGGAPEQQKTILFNLFVIMQLLNAFNCREIDNQSIFKNLLLNKSMIIVFAITLAVQLIVSQFFGIIFRTVPLSLIMWLKIFAYAFLVIIISEVAKYFLRKKLS